MNKRVTRQLITVRNLIILILGSVLALCGCAHREEMRFTQGKGDAGKFILGHAFARGADPITTNALPAITGPWTYSVDEYGVVIRLAKEDYDSVESLLRLSFGKPKIGPMETRDGGRMGMYRLTPKGVVLSFCGHSNCTEVIVIRQLAKEEFGVVVVKAFKELEKQGKD